MAYTECGYDLIDRDTYGRAGGYTVILLAQAASRGILKELSVYAYAGGTIKPKVFRDDGTNFVFIGESPAVAITAGQVNKIPCWIPMEAGDQIGFYQDTNNLEFSNSGTGGIRSKAGDITTTSLKSGWEDFSGRPISVKGKIFSKGILL